MPNLPNILIGDYPQYFARYHTTLRAGQFLRLRHRKRFFGGDWELSFFLPEEGLGTAVLDGYYETLLMAQIAEYYEGSIPFVGVCWEMIRTKDGKRTVKSMSDVYNAVSCIYTVTDSSTQVETAYQTNDDSIARYLRREQLVYKDNCEPAEAIAEAQSFLNTHYDAWGKSTDFNTSQPDGLEVTVMGMGRLFNNFYSQATTPNSLIQVDAFVEAVWTTDLTGNLTFLGNGGVETNTKEVQRELRAPTKAGDLIDLLARKGDDTVPFRWYVTSDMQFRFEPLNITPTLEWRGRKRGGLFRVGGAAVNWNATPGVLKDNTMQQMPALTGSYLAKRNHELVEEFSMWQGDDQAVPTTEDATEEQMLTNARRYEQMITSGDFDTLHTPQSTLGGEE